MEVERQGRIGVLICSAPFEALARAQAAARGKKDLRAAVLPHPLRSLREPDLREQGVISTGVDQVVSQFAEARDS